MYLLDTNICIAILKNNENTIYNFSLKYQDCYLSTLVLAELYKGVYCSAKVEKNLDRLSQFERQLPKVNFDKQAALEFGKI